MPMEEEVDNLKEYERIRDQHENGWDVVQYDPKHIRLRMESYFYRVTSFYVLVDPIMKNRIVSSKS